MLMLKAGGRVFYKNESSNSHFKKSSLVLGSSLIFGSSLKKDSLLDFVSFSSVMCTSFTVKIDK